MQLIFRSVFHALCNRILVAAGKRRKHQCARIRGSFVHMHTRAFFIFVHKVRHVGEVKLRVNTVGVHVHRKRNDIHVAGTFTVAEQRTLYAVCAGKERQLGVRNTRAAVVVRVQRQSHEFTVLEVLAHVLDLRSIHVRHTHFHRDRQIDDNVVRLARLQNVENRIADLQRVFRLGARKGLRRILKAEVAFVFGRKLFDELRTVYGDLLDLLLGLLKHLLALCNADRVIEVDNRARCALARVECLTDDVLAALGEHLHGNVLGNHVVVNQRAEELIFRLARRREADLDLLKADLQKHFVVFKFFFKAHRDDKALVAVAHIHAAPDRRLFNVVFFHPLVIFFRYREVPDLIFACVHHFAFSSQPLVVLKPASRRAFLIVFTWLLSRVSISMRRKQPLMLSVLPFS